MSVLGGAEIRSRLAFRPEERRSLVVAPLLDLAAISSDAVDLRLGTHFLLPRGFQEPFYSLDRRSADSFHSRLHVPFGEFLVVPAHQTVLGSTLEFIKLPHDVSGEVLTKSSVARTFVLIETAPWIHPEYRGCLTLEIANVSNTPVLLYPGRYIAQLVLFRTEPQAEVGDSEPEKLEDKYFGPIAPEASRFHDPREDLGKLGISEVRSLRFGREIDGRFVADEE